MKYMICFEAKHYNKLDLDNMNDEQRWDMACESMRAGKFNAWYVTLDEWMNQYNTGRIPESGSLYIYLVEKDLEESICVDNVSWECSVNTDEAWAFYKEIAMPQLSHYIDDYNGDMSVFSNPKTKGFWYECWIDLDENWVDGEKIYLQVKDMDLRLVGKYLFDKMCMFEAYYGSPQYCEDLNKMVATAEFND